MIVVIPHVGDVALPVIDALLNLGVKPWMADVSGGDERYFDLLEDFWNERQSFVIVEHDIVVTPEAWEELTTCNAAWCAQPYPYMESTHVGLGCTRFDAEFTLKHAGIMGVVAQADYPKHGPKHWCSLDQALTNALRAKGESVHRHQHLVEHLGDNWPAHGCRVRPVSFG